MITVAALILACGRTCFPHTWQGSVVFLASLVVAVVVRVRLFAARNTPQAHRRRMLTLLHRLGGATLVWDAYEGGLISRTWRNEDGTWENLKIGGLHLLDTAGNRVPLPATWPAAEGRRPIEHDCAHDAHELAQHYSTEPGHYVLALPKGTVISTPAHLPAVEPEPTPPQAPLPAQPERTAESLAKEPSPLEQVMVGALLALLAGAVLLVVVVLLTGSLVIR